MRLTAANPREASSRRSRRLLAAAFAATFAFVLSGSVATAEQPPAVGTAKAVNGSVSVTWTLPPGLTSSDIYWNTDSTPFNAAYDGADWKWPDHGTPLACIGEYTHSQTTCTGYSDLPDSATSYTITGLVPGTYYVQVATFYKNEPNMTSTGEPTYYSNVVTVVVPAASSGGGTEGGDQVGLSHPATVTHSDGTTESDTTTATLGPGDTLAAGNTPLTISDRYGTTVLDRGAKIEANGTKVWTLARGSLYSASISGPCRPVMGVNTAVGGGGSCAYSISITGNRDVIRCYKGGCAVLTNRRNLLHPGQQTTVGAGTTRLTVVRFTPAPHPFWGH